MNPDDMSGETRVPGRYPEWTKTQLLDRLWKEGYVHIDFGRSGPNVDVATPVLYGLSSKGLVDIGKFPDPDEKLARAFEEAARLLEQEQSIPPEEKRDMLETISKVVALLNNVQGLGTAVAQGLGPPPGG